MVVPVRLTLSVTLLQHRCLHFVRLQLVSFVPEVLRFLIRLTQRSDLDNSDSSSYRIFSAADGHHLGFSPSSICTLHYFLSPPPISRQPPGVNLG